MKSRLRSIMLAEGLGTAMLLCTVIGSGIMAERLAAGNAAVALLANTAATGCMLYVLITLLGSISGAHFNPLVTLLCRAQGVLNNSQTTGMILAQALGAVIGAALANAMFELPLLHLSQKARVGNPLLLGEVIATAGLIFIVLRAKADQAAGLIAAYISAAYWFTSSTSFANPAAVLGRVFSDSFAGIAPVAAPGFVLAQCVGLALAVLLHKALGDLKTD
jgi:glycerol uptake facilitator-like aquaporin